MMTDDATWFTEFMQAQKSTLGHGGRELFSPLYSHHIIGPVIGVLREAKRNNHGSLANLTTDWLRAYWAVLSLGANPLNPSSTTVRIEGQPNTVDNLNNFYTGLSVAIPGPRASDYSAGGSLMPPMLAFAIDFTPKNWTKKMNIDSWFSHILNFFLALDAPLNNNTLNPPNFSFPSEKFGLSSAERSLLKNFVNNHDPGAINQIAGMIEPYFPYQPITFIRTSTGVFSYFGDSDRATATNPNPNKCPFFIVSETNAGQYIAYHPHIHDKAGCPQGRSGRVGNQICATGHTVTDCAEVTGSVIYEVVWRKSGSVGVLDRIR